MNADSRFDVERLDFLLGVEMSMLEWASNGLADRDGGQHQSSIWQMHIDCYTECFVGSGVDILEGKIMAISL